MEVSKKSKKKSRFLWIVLGLIVLAARLFYLKSNSDQNAQIPLLTVETPQKLSKSSDEIFVLDVRISDLGDALYPAASMSISFDSSCLEFIGLEEGNLFVLDHANGAGKARKLPEWNCNPEVCNRSGLINLMYLDMTGGKYAFSRTLLDENASEHVAVRLKFRLRGSVRPGDVYELIVEDAVFAASDETKSLAMAKETLRTKNSRIVIGE